jgi:hypothetical protein
VAEGVIGALHEGAVLVGDHAGHGPPYTL